MKLSEAIRKGCSILGESRIFIGETLKCGCAIGAAAVATGYPIKGAGQLVLNQHLMRAIPGVTREMLEEISVKHYAGMVGHGERLTREQIADWVEREYESKPPQKARESDSDYTKRILSEISQMQPVAGQQEDERLDSPNHTPYRYGR